MEENIYKVSDFAIKLESYIKQNHQFNNINLKGEIANLVFHKKGHIYFSLKDKEAKIDCAIWYSNASKFIKLNIKEGNEVIALGTLSYYKQGGKITFVVTKLRKDGIGELANIFEKRKIELEAKGWFDQKNKKPICKYPTNIGIVTAPTGDAVRDLIATMHRRYPSVNIYLFPALVQGEGAAIDIAKKINQANNFKIKLDTLIVGRGGGSYEDLWAFNEMEVIEAIKNSQIPIITGIGHQPDETLADYVADLRASTPTAAGEKATPDKENIISNLDYLQKNFKNTVFNKIFETEKQLDNYLKIYKNWFLYKKDSIRYQLNNYQKGFKNWFFYKKEAIKKYFNSWINNFNFQYNKKIENSKQAIIYESKNLVNSLLKIKEKYNGCVKLYDEKLKQHDQNLILKKGYAILIQNEKVIKSVKDVNKKDDIIAILHDGNIDLNYKKGRN